MGLSNLFIEAETERVVRRAAKTHRIGSVCRQWGSRHVAGLRQRTLQLTVDAVITDFPEKAIAIRDGLTFMNLY